jgi:hypothetical protein
VPTEYTPDASRLHAGLLLLAAKLIPTVLDLWREHKSIEPTLLLWPKHPVKTITGEPASLVTVDLPQDADQRHAKIIEVAKACDAYGLLLIEQLDDDVRMIFESEQGTRTWRFPIKNHGDVRILGRPSHKDNAESIGVRWTAN